jgi:hypothetical protein
MILLSDAGWSPPRIAGHLKYHAKTVRLALERFNIEQEDRQKTPTGPSIA